MIYDLVIDDSEIFFILRFFLVSSPVNLSLV